MAGTVTLQFGGLAPGYCMTTFNKLGLDIIVATTASLAGTLNTFNYGNSTPAAVDQDKPWFRLNSDGTPDRWYVFSSGLWLSAHYQCPGQVIMYEGTLASIDTFDGGEVAAVTATTGPFWERVTTMDARSPIGPGTLPSTTVVNIGDDLGEEVHELTIPEMPSHRHEYATTDGQQIVVKVTSNKTDDLNRTGSYDIKAADPMQNTGGDATGATVGHNTIHPVHAIWFIRRTSRLYYRI
jgi:hypothetical protein